ncbi:MAG: ankyrin repeat domain-containing protein [Salinibacter sp.]
MDCGAGAQPNPTTNKGRNSLHHAATQGSVAMIDRLVDGGPTPNSVNKGGWTSLEEAISEGQYMQADALRRHGPKKAEDLQ